jgi:hypothetical protein
MERSGLRVTVLAEPDLLLLGRLQQLGESQVQRFGESSQSAEGGISETPLDLADVRTVGPGQLAQPVLTPASTDASDSDGLTECPREVVGVRHGAQRTAGQALRPRDMDDRTGFMYARSRSLIQVVRLLSVEGGRESWL